MLLLADIGYGASLCMWVLAYRFWHWHGIIKFPNSEYMAPHFKDINHLFMYLGSTPSLPTFTGAIFLKNSNDLGTSTAGNIIFLMFNVPI